MIPIAVRLFASPCVRPRCLPRADSISVLTQSVIGVESVPVSSAGPVHRRVIEVAPGWERTGSSKDPSAQASNWSAPIRRRSDRAAQRWPKRGIASHNLVRHGSRQKRRGSDRPGRTASRDPIVCPWSEPSRARCALGGHTCGSAAGQEFVVADRSSKASPSPRRGPHFAWVCDKTPVPLRVYASRCRRLSEAEPARAFEARCADGDVLRPLGRP